MEYEVYKMNQINNNEKITTIMNGLIIFYTEEERSHNLVVKLQKNDNAPRHMFIITFDDVNISEVKELMNGHDIIFTIYSLPLNLSENILPCLKEINIFMNNKTVVGIDISSMPIPIFSQILNFLFKKHTEKQIIVYYTEPKQYNLDNLFDYTSYDGEIDIKVIPGFEGKTSTIDETQRLIIYHLGFEINHLSRIIPQETNPNEIIPINGFPSYFPKYKDISLINNNKNFHEQAVEIIFATANNPFEIYNQMSQIKLKKHKYCIDIIPTGTKPMALGACLFALKCGNNDIRILFPYPSEYKRKQSSGSGILWEYIISDIEKENMYERN